MNSSLILKFFFSTKYFTFCSFSTGLISMWFVGHCKSGNSYTPDHSFRRNLRKRFLRSSLFLGTQFEFVALNLNFASITKQNLSNYLNVSRLCRNDFMQAPPEAWFQESFCWFNSTLLMIPALEIQENCSKMPQQARCNGFPWIHPDIITRYC